MIIDQMTLRVKNIIFFKAVCVGLGYAILSYSISNFVEQRASAKIQNAKASEMSLDAEERLNALNTQNQKLQEAVKKYQELKQNAMASREECFDKAGYQNSLKEAEKTFGLKDPLNIFISSSPAIKKEQLKQTILLKNTNVKLDYHIDNFLAAVRFARTAYQALPPYSLVQKFEITKHDTITPELAKWLETANELSLISAVITMEVREINLNESN